jgi:serine/threonine-protein kinase
MTTQTQVRYEIKIPSIGEGGFGTIDKAWDTELDRFVAIKTLDPLFKSNPTQNDIDRFKREAKTLARLSYPNIPAVYDVLFNQTESSFKIIIEWIEGSVARAHLSDKGPWSLEQTKKWFTSICQALDHAHTAGIVHRDIKPSNLIISEDEQSCYVVDFGISLNQSDLDRISQGTRLGTPGYMAPEQENGQEVDARADIFSLGIILYEFLSGIKPKVGEYVRVSSQNDAIPPAIDDLILQCLDSKERRPASAGEFLGKLLDAFRPTSTFQLTLTDGQLYQINSQLHEMDASQFQQLPIGQKILLHTKVCSLAENANPRLNFAIASLLSECVRIAYSSPTPSYIDYITHAFSYGFDVEYGERWSGNPTLRSSLIAAARVPNADGLKSLCEAINSRQELNVAPTKPIWYKSDLLKIVENVLANPLCPEEQAPKLGQLYAKIV